jgi:putative methyltransferase
LKILFYYSSIAEIYRRNNKPRKYIETVDLYLKTHIDTFNPILAQQLEWLPTQQGELSDDQLIALITETKPDIFCTSHFLWNHTNIMAQLSRIRPQIDPNIIFVAGGPSIDVNINPNFFQEYPFINYAVYGPGERGFYDLMNSLINNNTLRSINTSNLAWYDHDKQKQIVAGYQYVPMNSISPYLHNKQRFTDAIRKEQAQGFALAISYELTRGCPYSCTFCDWNSGLGNKTTRRKNTYQEEIDLFHELELYDLYLGDANTGQYQEDIDMFNYFADLNINKGANFKLKGNYSKLQKDNNLKLFHILAQGNLSENGFVTAIQDINPQILKNIDRPSISWEEQVKIIDELYVAYPHLHSHIQLIQGLPGQTVASWRETLKEICKRPVTLQIFVNELLAASPAIRDPNYQEKWQYTYSDSVRYTARTNPPSYFRARFSQSCISFTQKEYVEISVLSHIYSALSGIKFAFGKYQKDFNIELYVEEFLKSKNYQMLVDNLYNNWLDDKFYYTINFDGNLYNVCACNGQEATMIWGHTKEFQNFILKHASNQEFIQEFTESLGTDRLLNAIAEY